MLKKKLTAVLIIIACTLPLVACGEKIDLMGASGSEVANTVINKEIHFPMNFCRTYHPVLSKDEDVYYIEKLIYDGLFSLDENLQAVPNLVERYEVSKDARSMTLHLKQGVLWHDGKSFTSKDVKYTIQAFQQYQKDPSCLYSKNVSQIKSVTTEGDFKVILEFTDNTGASLERLTFPILPEHQYGSVKSMLKHVDDFKPVGTGPYCVEKIEKDTSLTLKGNQTYHGSVKPSNTLVFKSIEEKQKAVNLFAINEFNVMFSKEVERDMIHANADVECTNFPSNEAEMVGFQMKNEFLSDKNSRKALACAIDSKKILELAYYNNGILCDNLYYPGYLGVENKGELYPLDLKEARKYLKKAGYVDANGDGWIEGKDGKNLSLSITVNKENPSRVMAAGLMKENIQELGIECSVFALDWATYTENISNGTYDLFLGGYQFEENYDLRFLLHSAFHVASGYHSEEVDSLLTEMEQGQGASEKKERYTTLKKRLNDELPYYCLFYKTYGEIAALNVKGENKPMFFDLYQGVENLELIVNEDKKK